MKKVLEYVHKEVMWLQICTKKEIYYTKHHIRHYWKFRSLLITNWPLVKTFKPFDMRSITRAIFLLASTVALFTCAVNGSKKHYIFVYLNYEKNIVLTRESFIKYGNVYLYFSESSSSIFHHQGDDLVSEDFMPMLDESLHGISCFFFY